MFRISKTFIMIMIVHVCYFGIQVLSYDSTFDEQGKNLNEAEGGKGNESSSRNETSFDTSYWYFDHDILDSAFDCYKYWKEFLTAKPSKTNPIDPQENCVLFVCQDSGYRTISKKYLYSVFNKAREAFADGSDFHGEAGWKTLRLNRNAKPGFGNIFHTMWDEDIAEYAQQKAALCLPSPENNLEVMLQDNGPISADWHSNPGMYPPGSTCDVDIQDSVIDARTYDFFACGTRPAPRKILYPSYEYNSMTTSLGKGKKMLHHTAAYGFGCGLVTRVKEGLVHQHFVCYFCPSALKAQTWYNEPNLPRPGLFCEWCNKSYDNVTTTCIDRVNSSLTHGQRFKHLCFTDVVPAKKFVDTSYSRILNCKCEHDDASGWAHTRMGITTEESVTSTSKGVTLIDVIFRRLTDSSGEVTSSGNRAPVNDITGSTKTHSKNVTANNDEEIIEGAASNVTIKLPEDNESTIKTDAVDIGVTSVIVVGFDDGLGNVVGYGDVIATDSGDDTTDDDGRLISGRKYDGADDNNGENEDEGDNDIRGSSTEEVFDIDLGSASTDEDLILKDPLPYDTFKKPRDSHPTTEHTFPIWLTAILTLLVLFCFVTTLVRVFRNSSGNSEGESADEDSFEEDDEL